MRNRDEKDDRRINNFKSQRHVHDYNDQPGRRCICGQPEHTLSGLGVRKSNKGES